MPVPVTGDLPMMTLAVLATVMSGLPAKEVPLVMPVTCCAGRAGPGPTWPWFTLMSPVTEVDALAGW